MFEAILQVAGPQFCSGLTGFSLTKTRRPLIAMVFFSKMTKSMALSTSFFTSMARLQAERLLVLGCRPRQAQPMLLFYGLTHSITLLSAFAQQPQMSSICEA